MTSFNTNNSKNHEKSCQKQVFLNTHYLKINFILKMILEVRFECTTIYIQVKCTPEKLRLFFKDIEIPPNGIVLVTDARGRNTGEGFIQFNSHEHADQALLKHKETIDRRFASFQTNFILSWRMFSCLVLPYLCSLFILAVNRGYL